MKSHPLSRDPKPLLSRDGKGAVSSERGFALLLIFVLAASVAIMLYLQMPRVAFESERDKEQLLIDRGEQYKRAIALFYTDNRRFPARVEDLENTNNHRYLRRRYLDPYTGKDEWRLIHTNGMFLTDSLVQKPPANPANNPGNQNNQTLALGTQPGNPGQNLTQNGGQNPPQNTPQNPNNPAQPQPVNAAVLARPSDRPINAGGAFQTASFQPQQAVNSGYIDPASYPPITLFPNGYNPPAQQPGQPGQVAQPGIPQPGGQFQAGVQPGFQPGVQTGFQPNQPFQPGLNPNQPGLNQPGQFPQGQFQPGFPQQQPQPFLGQTVNPADPNGNPNLPTGAQPFPLPNQQNPTPPNLNPNLQGGIVPLPGLNPSFPNQLPQQTPNPILPNTPPFDPNNPSNPVQQQQPFPQSQPFPQQQPFPNQQPFPQQQQPFPQQQAANPQTLNGPPPPGSAGPPNPALNLVNQLLTTPRGTPPPTTVSSLSGPAQAGNQTVGAGIAGVASTFKGPTIKTYAEKMKFEEWEFVYQLQQQQGIPGAGANPLQNGQNGNNPNNPNAPGTQPNSLNAPAGINPGGTTSGGFNPTGFTPGTSPGGINPGLPPLPPQQPNGFPPQQPNGFPPQQ